MNRCYNFGATQKHGQYVAYLPEKSQIENLEMEKYLIRENCFPCELILKPFKEKYKDFPVVWHDYMYNEFAFALVSERLKAFLVERTTKKDSIEWINVKVRHEQVVKNYYIVMFTKLFDVIDEQNTSYYLEGTRILVPCFAFEKAETYSIFTVNWNNDCPCFPSLLYTTEKIKKELQKAKFSNLIFEKAKTSYNGTIVK